MKRALSILLVLATILLSSCNANVTNDSGDPEITTRADIIPSTSTSPEITDDLEPTTSPDESHGEPIDTIDYYDDPIGYLRQNMPVIDGSTSLIPLEGGIKATIFDVSQSEGEKMVYHTTTYGSFYNLLDGGCDMILSVPLSEEQYNHAQERGIKLEEVPIAKEGFVFVVNYNNPVDTLTQQQLRDIYSGKITNWKEVGGWDEEIIAYQRDWTSGSQNFMITFMGDTPLIDAPTELRPDSMVGLMNVIAINENAENSIGYSVYAYAADMYGTGKDVKFIKVDGVEPNKQTMASGEYPLMSYNYAIFNADEPEDSPVRRLADWMTSYEGQLAIAKAGYITVKDIGYDYEEMTLKLWSGKGTGAAKPKDYRVPTNEYAPFLGKVDSYWYWNINERYKVPLNEIKPENATGLAKGVRFELDCLTNLELQAEINGWIAEGMARADEMADEFEEYIDNLNGNSQREWYFYSDISDRYSMIRKEDYHPSASCIATARNGYLSVTVAMTYTLGAMDGYQRHYHIETGVWDIITGDKLEITDLFYSNVDIAKVLNEYLRRASQEPLDAFGTYHEMKRDFAGLTMTGWTMTADTIYVFPDNPYFHYGAAFELDLPDGYLVCEQPRDMSDCFDTVKVPVKRFFRKTYKNVDYRFICDNFIACEFLAEDSYPMAKAINSKIIALSEEYFSRDKVFGYFIDQGIPEEEIYFLDNVWKMEEYAGKFVKYANWLNSLHHDGKIYLYPYCNQPLFFDLQTGDYLDWRTLVDRSWLEDNKKKTGKLKDMALIDISFDNAYITLVFQKSGDAYGEPYTLYIPPEYINW
jgi:phosphate transport system substrate-binding protein